MPGFVISGRKLVPAQLCSCHSLPACFMTGLLPCPSLRLWKAGLSSSRGTRALKSFCPEVASCMPSDSACTSATPGLSCPPSSSASRSPELLRLHTLAYLFLTSSSEVPSHLRPAHPPKQAKITYSKGPREISESSWAEGSLPCSGHHLGPGASYHPVATLCSS